MECMVVGSDVKLEVKLSEYGVLKITYGDVTIIVGRNGNVTIYGDQSAEVYYTKKVRVAYAEVVIIDYAKERNTYVEINAGDYPRVRVRREP